MSSVKALTSRACPLASLTCPLTRLDGGHTDLMTSPADREPHHVLVAKVRVALGLNQKELAAQLGVSSKTIGRWMKSGTMLASYQARRLVDLLAPVDRDLAARVAATQGETLATLGLETPAQPTHDVAVLPLAVDAVVCAAAEALDLSPRAVRPALVAAVRRAREAGVTMEQVEAALAAAGPMLPAIQAGRAPA